MSPHEAPIRILHLARDQFFTETVNVLDVPVAVLRRAELTELLDQALRSGLRGWISYVNVHAINLATELPWFRSFMKESLVTYCDGEGVRLGAKISGRRIPERIVTTDWLYDVCDLAQRTGRKIYFLGSTKSVVAKTVLALRNLYPGLQVSGFHNGFLDSVDITEVVGDINSSGTDILVIGMGMPLQERWILDNYRDLNAKIILNAGSCFDYVSGMKKRCPRFMGNIGLEWLYRLLQEPRRLWQRYLIGNPRFVLLCLRDALRNSPERMA